MSSLYYLSSSIRCCHGLVDVVELAIIHRFLSRLNAFNALFSDNSWQVSELVGKPTKIINHLPLSQGNISLSIGYFCITKWCQYQAFIIVFLVIFNIYNSQIVRCWIIKFPQFLLLVKSHSLENMAIGSTEMTRSIKYSNEDVGDKRGFSLICSLEGVFLLEQRVYLKRKEILYRLVIHCYFLIIRERQTDCLLLIEISRE